MYATSGGHINTMHVLLDRGAKVNAQDEDGDTALAYAAIRGAPIGAVKELLNKSADVNIHNKGGKTALMLARDQKKGEIIKLLKQAGAKD
jgi:uncharacterized protein